MEPWLQSATEYIRSWIEFQVRASRQPGCIVAIAHRGKVVAECAFDHAKLVTGEKLTPCYRFRIALQSKSFTAAGIMKLRERRRLRLDDPVGQYVKGLQKIRGGGDGAQIRATQTPVCPLTIPTGPRCPPAPGSSPVSTSTAKVV